MAQIAQTAIRAADTASIDAFARLRTGEPYGLFDGKIIHADNTLLWDDATTSGAAGSTYSALKSSVTLDVTNETGTRVRQTKQRFNYQPGKSQLVLATFTLGAATANVTKRVGYFDDQNGLFLEQTTNGLAFVRRTYTSGATVDHRIPQAQWNLKRFNGSDTDFAPLDMAQSQILVIDFEWLGVGRVRFGFVVDGLIVYCHEMNHANHVAGVYMTTPNLPIRYELSSSTDATATLECICSSVASEGGYQPPGIQYSIDRGITAFSTLSNTSVYPVLSYRVGTGYKGARVEAVSFSLTCTTTATYRWLLVANPTISGTALSFAAVTGTACEVAAGTTNATTVTDQALVIASGYSTDTAQSRSVISTGLTSRYVPGFTIAGVSDIISLCVQNVAGAVEDYYASIGLNEVS